MTGRFIWTERKKTMFVILLEIQKTLREMEKHLQAHRESASEVLRSEQVVCSGPQIPREGGVVIKPCPTARKTWHR
jgi:uncharacterized protein YciI